MGKSSNSEISQELISLGSGNIEKCAGICSGKREHKMLVSAALLQCHSQGSICNIILLPGEPFAVSLDICIYK
jgi:hypothetical protein